MNVRYLVFAGLMAALTITSVAWAEAPARWFKTPQQQALSLYESERFDTLESLAPDTTWQGISQFKQGRFEDAIESFSKDAQDLEGAAGRRAAYNEATARVQAGDYAGAIEQFDALLETQPDHADAAHNRDIAQALLELQQQQQQGEQGQQDAGENSDSGEQDGENSQSSDNSSDDGSSDEASDEDAEQNAQSPSQGGAGEADPLNDNDPADAGDDDEVAEAEAALRQALEQNNDSEPSNEAAMQPELLETMEPMSESEQAAEQLLRRIPDDPAGLLRRKLEHSHRLEYPEVGDSATPW